MPRTLSTAYLRELLSPASSVFGLAFIVLSHPRLPQPIMVVSDVTQLNGGVHVPYILHGDSYQTFPFELALFNDSGDIPQTKIIIQNVDRRIGLSIMALPADTALELSISVYSSADFVINGGGTAMVAVGTPTLEYQCPVSFVRNIEWDEGTVTGDVRLFDPSRERWPYIKASPDVAPGLWM